MRAAAFFNQITWDTFVGRRIYNNVVVVTRYGDLVQMESPLFPMAQTLVFDKCDKRFVDYQMSRRLRVFPQLQRIIFNSQPCDPLVWRCLLLSRVDVTVNNQFRRHVSGWEELASVDELDAMIASLKHEEIRT